MRLLSQSSFQTKFTLLLGSVVFLVLAAVGGFFLRAAYDNILGQTYSRLQTSADRRVSTLVSFLDRVGADVNYLSHAPQLFNYLSAVADNNPEEITQQQRQLSEDYLAFAMSRGIYYQIRYINRFGDEVAGADTTASGVSTIATQSQLQNRSDAPIFYETFSLSEGQVYVSSMALEASDGVIEVPYRPIIRYAIPVITDGERQGVIVLALYASALTDTLKSGLFPAYLVDEQGYYLYNADGAKLWGRELNTGSSLIRDVPELAGTLQTDGPGIVQAGDFIFAHMPIKLSDEAGPRWHIITYTPVSEAVQPLAATLLPSAIVLLAVLFISLGIATLAIRSLVAPLRELTSAADRVAAGDLNFEIKTQSRDEFGRLTSAFNSMAANLRNTITSLETQVTRRTERLEALNHELKTEISERQKVDATLRDSEERFRRTFEDSPLGMAVVALNFKFVTVNATLCRMLGYSNDELVALTFPQITHPDDVDADVRLAERLIRGEIPNYSIEKRYFKKNGDVLWIRLTVAFVRDEANNPLYFLSMIEDIAERKRAETDLQTANGRLTTGMVELERRNNEAALLNAMGELLQSCDDITEAYYVIRNISQKLFPDEIGMLNITASSRNFLETTAQWGDIKVTETVFSPADCWALRRGRVHFSEPNDGSLACKHLSSLSTSAHLCIPLLAHGESIGVLSLCQVEGSETGALKDRQRMAQTVADSVSLALANLRLRDTLRNQSIRDGLTGLFNRRYMEETLEREIRRAARGKYSVGVMMIDIDHFKVFNDTFGHAAGDAMLTELGRLFSQSLRGGDIACRYGGEEFTVILLEATLEATKIKAEALREEFKKIHLTHEGRQLGVATLSIGVSAAPNHGATGEALLRCADLALYDAKHSGRDRVSTPPTS